MARARSVRHRGGHPTIGLERAFRAMDHRCWLRRALADEWRATSVFWRSVKEPPSLHGWTRSFQMEVMKELLRRVNTHPGIGINSLHLDGEGVKKLTEFANDIDVPGTLRSNQKPPRPPTR